MDEYENSFIYKFRFLFAGLLISGSFLLLCFIISGISTVDGASGPARSTGSDMVGSTDSPNALTSGTASALEGFSKSISVTQKSGSVASHGIGHVLSRTSRATGHSISTAAATTEHGLGSAASRSGRVASNGLAYILFLPVRLFNNLATVPLTSALIQPADHTAVPVIDPASAELAAAKKALPGNVNSTAIWPLHGEITTQFGVPELPYQAIHTGLDISDGTRPGTTAVKAYREGTIIGTITSGGLGNHVIIDHGSGVTSVYGHLAAIEVQVGQHVVAGTVIGLEGTTGVSTGTHLHFEIRVNGQASDLHGFISGQPYF